MQIWQGSGGIHELFHMYEFLRMRNIRLLDSLVEDLTSSKSGEKTIFSDK